MSILYLLRHAHYDRLGRDLVGREIGIHLSARGVEEAATLAAALGRISFDRVFASPRERARETARPIAARAGVDVKIAEAVDEMDFGRWTGRSFAELDRDPAWREFNSQRGRAVVPAGETMLDVQRRVVAFLATEASRSCDGNVAVVTHGDVIRAALLHYLGMPLDFVHRLHISPASVSVLELGVTQERVLGINFTLEWLCGRNPL